MRLKLSRLIVRSPLPGVAELMQAVTACATQVPPLIDRLFQGDREGLESLVKEISRLEGAADDVKNRVREHLPTGLFLPVDRRDILRLLSEIDAIADCAEDVGVLFTLRKMESPPEAMAPLLEIFVQRVMDTVRCAGRLVDTLDTLLESSFTDRAVDRSRHLIDELHRLEHEADKIQDQIAKLLFQQEDVMPPVGIFMWTKILNKLGDMANHAENVGDQFRLLIAR